MTNPHSDDLNIELDDHGSRYVARIGDRIAGVIEFSLRDRTMIIVHTGTRPEFRGQGIAAKITTYALDDARGRGLGVVPQCPYTEQFIDEHPDYADLVTDTAP